MICPVCQTENAADNNYCKSCGSALKEEMEDYRNILQKATLLESDGQIDEALAEFIRADNIKRTPEICLHIANLFYRLGDLQESIERYNLCLGVKPNQAGAHYGLGLALYRVAKITEAIDQFRQTIRIDPDFLMAYYWLGICFFHHSQMQEACRTLRQLVEKKPDFTIAYYHLGEACAQLGNTDDTIANFEKVVERNDQDVPAYFHLGLAYYKKGELDRSITSFKKVLDLDPDHERARQNLKSLEDIRHNFY